MRKQHTRNVVTLLFAVTAMAPGLTHAVQADAEVSKLDDPRVVQLIQQANKRVAKGESPAIVERWLTSAVDNLGVEKSPQSWDVYGRNRWGQEDDKSSSASMATP